MYSHKEMQSNNHSENLMMIECNNDVRNLKT